jgi:hypothetical protein
MEIHVSSLLFLSTVESAEGSVAVGAIEVSEAKDAMAVADAVYLKKSSPIIILSK